MKANCYKCKYRGEVPGSAHSKCLHPEVPSGGSMYELLSMFPASRRGGMPPLNSERFKIKGNPHGIAKGWFAWPLNFDPTWLENCDAYECVAQTEPQDAK